MRTGELVRHTPIHRTAFKKIGRSSEGGIRTGNAIDKGVVAARIRTRCLTALRNENDTICGDIVRFRDGMVCRHCHQPARGRKAQWSHIFVRELLGTRWNSRNAFLFCSDCHHGWWEGLSRKDQVAWAGAQLGEGELDQLWAESIALLHDRQGFYEAENARLKAEYRALTGNPWSTK
jgi:hypothetical protein